MYLKVINASKLDSTLKDGDVISFIAMDHGSNVIHAKNLLGNKIMVKFQGGVKIKKEFFNILTPVKQK
ncbi:MAG: hypothetical protein ACTSYC_08155 [Promethearchaeota archaeon]